MSMESSVVLPFGVGCLVDVESSRSTLHMPVTSGELCQLGSWDRSGIGFRSFGPIVPLRCSRGLRICSSQPGTVWRLSVCTLVAAKALECPTGCVVGFSLSGVLYVSWCFRSSLARRSYGFCPVFHNKLSSMFFFLLFWHLSLCGAFLL